MDISQSAIALLYLYACLLGAALGLLYDACRITRIFLGEHYSRRAVARLHALRLPLIGGYRAHRARRSLRVVIFIEDFFFCILSGVAIILLCYEAFNGNIRIPVFLCAAGGFALYRCTLGKVIMLFSEVIAFGVECVLRYCVFFVLFPFRWAGGRLYRLLRGAAGSVRRGAWKRSRAAYTEREMKAARSGGILLPRDGQNRKDNQNAKGKAKKKAVQPESAGQSVSRGDDRGVARGVHQRRDAL